LSEAAGKGDQFRQTIRLVACVEDNNFASLKSVYRMGDKDFGRIYILGCFGEYLIHSSPGCYESGVSITRRAADFERSD
jgi:hypothetical protein